jgi:hypothetical protein
MKQQHHPYDNRLYSKGANRDIDDELLDKADGQYIDACNMRVESKRLMVRLFFTQT